MADQKRTASFDWEDLRYFVALARHGTLSATARALRVNHATVARRVSSLEAALGHDLFDRRGARYALTKEGETVLNEALPVEGAALTIQDRLAAGAELRGAVRLTTVLPLADHFLIDRLSDFRRRYPGIEIEVITNLRVVSVARREADIALRFGRPRDAELVGRPVAHVAYAYYAMARYWRQIGKGEQPALIGYDDDNEFIWAATWMRDRFTQFRFSFRSNSYTSHAAAARAGFGIALLPCFIGDADRTLVRVDFAELPPKRDIWLLTRLDLSRVPRIRATIDYLDELFRKERAALSGTSK